MIGVVDYGMGNLHSVAKALEMAGAHAVVSDSPKKLGAANALVVPGVGAFGAAMKELAHRKLDDFITGWLGQQKPYLGICLGLQILFEYSEETPQAKGLGLIGGFVKKFSKSKTDKIPHMGWNQVNVVHKSDMFKGIPDKPHFYFVHSYYPVPDNIDYTACTTDYGVTFCSGIYRNNLFASQFHPEKSGAAGLALLRNFVRKYNQGE